MKLVATSGVFMTVLLQILRRISLEACVSVLYRLCCKYIFHTACYQSYPVGSGNVGLSSLSHKCCDTHVAYPVRVNTSSTQPS